VAVFADLIYPRMGGKEAAGLPVSAQPTALSAAVHVIAGD